MTDDKVLSEISDNVGWLTFNNPERRNAMRLDMWQATDAILEKFENDPSVRVIVMRGAGEKAFMSGADISQFEDLRKTAEQADTYAKISAVTKARIAALSKPLIAMIHGFCVGGGVAVAIMTDLRIASDEAIFAIPAAKLGLAYAHESLAQLVTLIGPACAKEMLFTARRMDASEALRIGLVNRVVPAAQLEAVVRELAREIAANAPLTIRAAKTGIDQMVRDPDKRDMALVESTFRACLESRDYAIGRQAFMEKRRPEFLGV